MGGNRFFGLLGITHLLFQTLAVKMMSTFGLYDTGILFDFILVFHPYLPRAITFLYFFSYVAI